jgi:hypothetical protein
MLSGPAYLIPPDKCEPSIWSLQFHKPAGSADFTVRQESRKEQQICSPRDSILVDTILVVLLRRSGGRSC